MLKRAATYPRNESSKRRDRSKFKEEISLEQTFHPPAPLSSPAWGPSLGATSGVPTEITDIHGPLDGIEADAEGSYDQVSHTSPLSAIEHSQEVNPGDFMAPFGSSWALDQCSSLYDLPIGDCSYAHDVVHLAESYQTQDYLAYTPGHDFYSIQTCSLCGKTSEASAPCHDVSGVKAEHDDLSTWAGVPSHAITN